MKKITESIAELIVKSDKTVKLSKGQTMGEKGLLFHEGETLKYAVTSSPSRITLHAMPMYCNERLQSKYKKILKDANFGKGCIRFNSTMKIDLGSLAKFLRECAKV